jgi:hypothetical protein
MKELLQQWMDLKNEERKAKEARELVEATIYTTLNQELENEDSQQTWNYDDYKLVIKPNFTVKVDQEYAVNYPEYFKTKYEMTYSQYKKADHRIVDDGVTISQGKPTFTISRG